MRNIEIGTAPRELLSRYRSRDHQTDGSEASGTNPPSFLSAFSPQKLHDIYALTPADAVSANGLSLGLAAQFASQKPILWGLCDMASVEAGAPYAPGLNEIGLRPHDLILARTKDVQTLLAVGEEALRSPALGAVVLSAWGESKALSLTASRRLSLAAKSAGVTLFLVRAGAQPAPSAAETRWAVRAAACSPLEGDAPGRPAFCVKLLRHRGGCEPRNWIVEWDREHCSFFERSAEAALSRSLVPLAAHRSIETRPTPLRRRFA